MKLFQQFYVKSTCKPWCSIAIWRKIILFCLAYKTFVLNFPCFCPFLTSNRCSVKNGTTTRTIVCQGCFHRLQARFEEPTRKHSPFESGRMWRQRPCRMVHWKEMCFCLQGKSCTHFVLERRVISAYNCALFTVFYIFEAF